MNCFITFSRSLFCLIFFSQVLLAKETPIMLCSGEDSQHGRANVVISKIWHHQEPGLEPSTTYTILTHYIGENSLGHWNRAGSSFSAIHTLSQEEMTTALGNNQFTFEQQRSHVADIFSLTIDLEALEGTISVVNGKPTFFNMPLKCTGNFKN